jgi:large subunit ribosomal protein L35
VAKIKTNRSADKRFSVTGGNKIKRGKASHSHLLSKKTPKHKRRLRHFAIIKTADVKRIKRLIPNAF